jgi:ribosomal protein L16 Arg81 hydroxylase
MPHRDFDLSTLLAPVGVETFFHDYWEKQSLHVAGREGNYYADVFTTADMDAVIAFTRPKFAEAAAFSGEAPRPKSFVQGWLAERVAPENASYPSIDDLQRVYAQGRTVVIMTMQQRWPALAVLCRRLESVFRCPVHANLYLTPPGAQGFDVHYDTHEVFVLQMEGHKHWRLYPPTRSLPLADERFQASREELGPVREIPLQAGDLLYLPRGHVHEAFTSDCASMHLTIGVHVFRWTDVLHEALDAAARRDERFRASTPHRLFHPGGLPDDIKERFRELLATLASTARLEEAARRLEDSFFAQMPLLPDGHFLAADSEGDLDLDTVLEKRTGAVCRILDEGVWIALEFPGGRIGGPRKIASALRFVAERERFVLRALPDDLSAESKLVLARRLVRERLLRVARSSPRRLQEE